MERIADPLAPEPMPERMRDIPHPIIGYVGNLSSKFDVELVDYLSREQPAWQFVFLGSMHLDDRLKQLQNRPNIHMLNVVLYDELAAYIKQFDVAIMPHVTNGQSLAMNPLKLFVYASYRKPIVTTNVPNIDEVAKLARVAETQEEFLRYVEEALNDRQLPDDSCYEQFLADNCWENRLSGMLSKIWPQPFGSAEAPAPSRDDP